MFRRRYLIIDEIKKELILLNQKYIDEAEDNYDFWNNHIKYVVSEAVNLAKAHKADLEIVELGALLHDVALVAKVGTKADHNINGAKLAEELLQKYDYPIEKMKRVIGCVLNHRSSKNATNIEELCVADADIIAHFYNIPNAFVIGVKKHNFSRPEEFMSWLAGDYEDLSEQTKHEFKDRFNNIMKTLFNDLWEEV
jgi:uncharacterized protein